MQSRAVPEPSFRFPDVASKKNLLGPRKSEGDNPEIAALVQSRVLGLYIKFLKGVSVVMRLPESEPVNVVTTFPCVSYAVSVKLP